ncbi:hypothetical protein ACN27G_34240 [Plantactinospora sp. WMMB334]
MVGTPISRRVEGNFPGDIQIRIVHQLEVDTPSEELPEFCHSATG